MTHLSDRRAVKRLTALAVSVYFASYLTRVGFTAILVEFVAKEGVNKTRAALLPAALALCYGFGQLASGWLGDRLDPKKLIFFGLLSSVLCNAALPFFSPNVALMTVIWALNGLAQAFLWPPLVKILVSALSEDDYRRVVPMISFGSGGGTIAVYLISPLLIWLFDWRAVFFFTAGTAFVALIFWGVCAPGILKGVSCRPAAPAATEKTEGNPLLALLPLLLAATVFAGMLREGINQWTPSILTETFKVPTRLSILTVTGLQIFHILCNLFTGRLLRKTGGKTLPLIFVFFGGMTVSLIPLVFFGTSSAPLTLGLLALSAIPANSINFLQVSALPGSFVGRHVSLISGLLNFATYLGSALSAYLFSRIAERFSWTFTFAGWVVAALAGGALSLAAAFVARRRIAKAAQAASLAKSAQPDEPAQTVEPEQDDEHAQAVEPAQPAENE